MRNFFLKVKKFILDLLFPKFCLNCNKEGSYLCQDCFSLIDIAERQYCPFCSSPRIVLDGKTCNSCRNSKKLAGLYCPTSYDNFIIKKAINQFKYQPYIKELAKPLASLIIAYLVNLKKLGDFSDFTPHHFLENNLKQTKFTENGAGFIIIPVPLHKKKLKKRGFNQAGEIAKELSRFLKIPAFNDVLVKIKQTPAQVELKKEQREENIKNVFNCREPNLVKKRKILLVDDIFTTGATMEESALTLKRAGAREVWGIVVARG